MAGSKDHRERIKFRVKDRDRLREIIRVEDIINRVQGFALATLERDEDGRLRIPEDKAMTADQLAAAKLVIGKALPDLSSVEIAPDPEAFTISAEPLSPEAWALAHAGQDGTETVQ